MAHSTIKSTCAATLLLAFTLALASPALAQTPSPSELANRVLHRRAVEAVIWGMPAVNYDLMLQEMLTKTPGKVNQVIYWGRPLDWHNQTLTPNPDTLYFMAFFNTKDVGPIVIEVPPADADGSLNANIVNVWQMPLEDAGLLGVDKGKGVKFVMLPPGYTDKIPDGYVALQSGHIRQLRADPLEPQEPQRRRRREVRRLRQADQGLSAVAGGQSAAHDVHRREGRALRFHHPLRRELLREARSHRAERAVARSRPGDDRSR